MVREVPPVRPVEQDEIGVEPRRDAALAAGEAEHVRRVDGARSQSLRRRQLQLRRRERADEREALAECAARVEVGRERDRGPGIDERARRRHRPIEKERARREEHTDDVARPEHLDSVLTCRLEMVDGAGSELDGEGDRTGLRELIPVEP